MAGRLQQLLAASAIACFCERLARQGKLPHTDEAELRILTVKFCKAFEIDTLAERAANNNDDMDYQIAAVDAEMSREDQPA